MFFASKELRNQSGPDSYHHPIGSLAENFEEHEIVSCLISIGISTRMIIDGPGPSLGGDKDFCGQLLQGPDLSEVNNLTVREACNKLVHAKRVRIDTEQDNFHNYYLTPTVYLYGTHQSKDWKAVLDLVKFASGVGSVVGW